MRLVKDPEYCLETGRRVTPAVGVCNHCSNHVVLEDSWSNECSCCHTEYNGSGQELAPREFWGEETGESFV